MESTVFVFLLALLNTWSSIASTGLLTPYDSEGTSGNGNDGGSGSDETNVTLSHSAISHSTSPLPSSVVSFSLVSSMKTSPVRDVLSSTGAFHHSTSADQYATGLQVPTLILDSHQTSIKVSLFTSVTSPVVATISSTHVSLFPFSQRTSVTTTSSSQTTTLVHTASVRVTHTLSILTPKPIMSELRSRVPGTTVVLESISPSLSLQVYTRPSISAQPTVKDEITSLPTLVPYSALSPPFSVSSTYTEVAKTLQPPQMTIHPHTLPSSTIVTPSPTQPHTMVGTADTGTHSNAVPTPSMDMGVMDTASAQSSHPFPYTAVGGSVGGCAIIVGAVIVVGVMLHKHRRRGTSYITNGNTSRTVGSINTGHFIPMSEIDGVLTTQLSMTSLMSTNSITSAPSMDIEKQMFDDTLNKAYKSSTFQRSKHIRHNDPNWRPTAELGRERSSTDGSPDRNSTNHNTDSSQMCESKEETLRSSDAGSLETSEAESGKSSGENEFEKVECGDVVENEETVEELFCGENLASVTEDEEIAPQDAVDKETPQDTVGTTTLQDAVDKEGPQETVDTPSMAQGSQSSPLKESAVQDSADSHADGEESHADWDGSCADGAESHGDGAESCADGEESHAHGVESHADGADKSLGTKV